MRDLFEKARQWFGQYLDPVDALTEVLGSVVSSLAITLGAGLVVQEGDQATRHLLYGIVGCNMAYGIVDGAMYLLDCLMERSSRARMLMSIHDAANDNEAMAIVQGELYPALALVTSPSERQRICSDILVVLKGAVPEKTRPRREDVYGALLVWCVVFLTALPAVIPFLLIDDRFIALRVSNALLLIMLFGSGYFWARQVHANPWKFGWSMLVAGLAMVAIVVAFGG
jgi:hypothetical protein